MHYETDLIYNSTYIIADIKQIIEQGRKQAYYGIGVFVRLLTKEELTNEIVRQKMIFRLQQKNNTPEE